MQYIRTCINGDQTRSFGVSEVHTQWMTHGWCIRLFPRGIRQQPAMIDPNVWRTNRTTSFFFVVNMIKRRILEASEIK